MTKENKNICIEYRNLASMRGSFEQRDRNSLNVTSVTNKTFNTNTHTHSNFQHVNNSKNVKHSVNPDKTINEKNDRQVKKLSFLNLNDLNVCNEIPEKKGFKTIDHNNKVKKLNRNRSNVLGKEKEMENIQRTLTTKTSFIGSTNNTNNLVKSNNSYKNAHLKTSSIKVYKPSTTFSMKKTNPDRKFLSSPGSKSNLLSNPNRFNKPNFGTNVNTSLNTGIITAIKRPSNDVLKKNSTEAKEFKININQAINKNEKANSGKSSTVEFKLHTPKPKNNPNNINNMYSHTNGYNTNINTNTNSNNTTNPNTKNKVAIQRQVSAKIVNAINKVINNNDKSHLIKTSNHGYNQTLPNLKRDDLNSTQKNLNRYIDKEIIIESDSKDFVEDDGPMLANTANNNFFSKEKEREKDLNSNKKPKTINKIMSTTKLDDYKRSNEKEKQDKPYQRTATMNNNPYKTLDKYNNPLIKKMKTLTRPGTSIKTDDEKYVNTRTHSKLFFLILILF